MDIDWSGHVVETPELSINYVRVGKGLPVVFLHGWPEFNRTWMHNLPVIAERFDVIAPDLRGFGRTTSKVARSPDGSSLQMLADDLKQFADALDLQRFAIVSHDVGAFVSQVFTRNWPERVSALFFSNCAYPGIGKRWGEAKNFPELWYQQFHQKDFAAALVGSSRDAARIYFGYCLRHWSHQKAAFDPHLEEWVDNFLRPGNMQGGFDWYIGVNRYRTQLMQGTAAPTPVITQPTYFLWGRHDPVLQFAWTDRLGEYFSNYQLECAEDAGHFVHFECPDLANQRMMTFLTEQFEF